MRLKYKELIKQYHKIEQDRSRLIQDTLLQWIDAQYPSQAKLEQVLVIDDSWKCSKRQLRLWMRRKMVTLA
jgi:hypothetical protein